MLIATKVEVTMQQICDLFVTAFEGGSNSWLRRASQQAGQTPTEKPWYSSLNIYDADLVIRLTYDNPSDSGVLIKDIKMDHIEAGLHEMSTMAPRHFTDVIHEAGDATTADVFLQFILFGELVYC